MRYFWHVLLWVGLWGSLTACSGLSLPDTAVLTDLLTPTAPATRQPTPTSVPTTPTPQPYTLSGFDAFVASVTNARRADRQNIVNDYMARLPQMPLITDGHAIFMWRGQAQRVQIMGDMNNWQAPVEPDEALPADLTPLPETDTWYLVLPIPEDGRLEYRFWLNGQREELDLLNPRTVLRPEGPRSELVMPGYELPPELVGAPVPPEARGTVTQETVDSAFLNETRTAFVYVPSVPPMADSGRYPTLYVNDGTAYLNQMKATAVLDWLIYNQEIPPITAVFVPPINRTAEYSQPDAYNQFLINELVPLVRDKYSVSRAASDTAVLGSSLGGLAALEAAFANPDIFGLVAAHSADLSIDNQAFTRRLQLQSAVPVRVHLGVGQYETAVLVPPATERHDLLAAKQALAQTLENKGFDYLLTEKAQGHNWGQWSEQFGTAVRFFFE
jgi:enterochelin esterase-like enzyme